MRDGEERHVLDIRVVLRGIRDNVVDVMIVLPPAQTQPANIVRYNVTKHAVDMEVVCNTHMASIMGSEDQLVPEAAEEKRRGRIPPHAKEHVEQCPAEAASTKFDEIAEVVAVIETLVPDPLVKLAVLFLDCLLVRCIEGRVFGDVENDFLLGSRVEEERLRLKCLARWSGH